MLTNFLITENGNLQITLTDEGREHLEEYADDNPSIYDLINYQLCNGWELINPKDIGALTDCDLILCNDSNHNKYGDIIKVGRIYWNSNYMTNDPLEDLKVFGVIILKGNN